MLGALIASPPHCELDKMMGFALLNPSYEGLGSLHDEIA
jgi:hypothetical protein